MKVYTNIKTLKQVKRMANEMGIGSAKLLQEQNISDLLDKLIDDGKLVEFLQTITRNNEIDFEEMEAHEVGEIIESFFTGIIKFLPNSLRVMIKPQITQKTSS
ncbi:MAG: hypothetical protein RBS16_01930 [Candidatus Cloacimonadales bacterium]|jgi:hypothetical protein|nr:hypothetical protein [Candidatus Cloacimonadota bacterium]MDX9976772.1 hypothetical protein [Candidatus Cloacimonadales bacterium]